MYTLEPRADVKQRTPRRATPHHTKSRLPSLRHTITLATEAARGTTSEPVGRADGGANPRGGQGLGVGLGVGLVE